MSVLSLVATSTGALLGAAVALVVEASHVVVPWEAVQAVLMSDRLHLSVGAGQLMGVVIAFTFLTGVAALWPALRAARLQPVSAISHVG